MRLIIKDIMKLLKVDKTTAEEVLEEKKQKNMQGEIVYE